MQNKLMKNGETIIRILKMQDNRLFVISCTQKSMPKWINQSELEAFVESTEEELLQVTNIILPDMELLDVENRKFVYEHYTMIAGILPFISDEEQRSNVIRRVSEEFNISKQTIRNYLCLYLIYQNIAVFAPKKYVRERQLTKDEKNIRWALNKFFYTKNKNSLKTAYTMMLKEKYCDVLGTLLPEYPSFYQFRYYYRKHRSLQTYYISRDGLSNYQRNNRP